MAQSSLYQSHQVRFRDVADSSQFNEHTNQVFYDLTELYNLANAQQDDINRFKELFEVNSHFALEQINQLESEVAALKEDINALQRPGREYKKIVYTTQIQADEEVPDYEKAVIDTQHDIVTLPTSNHSDSKLYLYDGINDEYIVPNTLEYNITPKADNVNIIENDFKNALIPDDQLFWHRKYITTAGVKSFVEAQIVLNLPDNIISSRDVNTIYIHPYPLRTMDIVDVEYQLDSSWKTIPGFKPIEKAANVKFCFSPTTMSKVRITLRQRHSIQKGNKNIYHMGIRELGVFYDDYQSGIGRFVVPVEFNRVFANKEIIAIKPIFQNEEALSVHQDNTRLATFKVYEIDAANKLRYLNDTFPIQVKERKILLKGIINLDKNTKTTPTLTGVEITYKGDS